MRFLSILIAAWLLIGPARGSVASQPYTVSVGWKADPVHPTVEYFALNGPDGREIWHSGDFNQNAWWISSTGLVIGLRSSGVEGMPGTLTFFGSRGEIVGAAGVIGFSGGRFCRNGNRFFACDLANSLSAYNERGDRLWSLRNGDAYEPSADGSLIAIARNGAVGLYDHGSFRHSLAWPGGPIRIIAFSGNGADLAAISADMMAVYEIEHGVKRWQWAPSGPSQEFVSLASDCSAGFVTTARDRVGKTSECYWAENGTVAAVREYSMNMPLRAVATRGAAEPKDGDAYWPIVPTDQVHPVGNGWGEYQNYSGRYPSYPPDPTSAYFHPGIDVMALTNIGVAVYAVAHGWVKAWLTTSAQWHWRLAIADSSTGYADTCGGWLYAHIDSTKPHLAVGDEVWPGDWIGSLVPWPVTGFDHCHFARISYAGATWNAGGADWRFIEDPLNLMTPTTDMSKPVIEDALPGSRFAFCANNSNTYLDPDSLWGDVDIVARIYDRFGQAITAYPEWEKLNPYRIDYAIRGQSASQPQRLSFLFGHQLDWENIELTGLAFKQEAYCVTWGDYDCRRYYYTVTNTDGDSLLEPSDTSGCWHTVSYANGQYWVVVYAADQYGNTTTDSQLVTINNPTGVGGSPGSSVFIAAALQAFPSPTSGPVSIHYTVPDPMQVTLRVFNLCGQVVRTLEQGVRSTGGHSAFWDGNIIGGSMAPNGVYIVQLDCPAGRIREKVVVIR